MAELTRPSVKPAGVMSYLTPSRMIQSLLAVPNELSVRPSSATQIRPPRAGSVKVRPSRLPQPPHFCGLPSQKCMKLQLT